MTGELFSLTAEQMTAGFQALKFSPVEVMDALARRVEAVNPLINALYFVDLERGLDEARASEKRWRRGEPVGPLDGVPATLKDGMPVAGTPAFGGSRAVNVESSVDTVDAPVAARLREAGAIILGRTTMPDFGLIASGLSSRFGVTRNPWNLTRNSGGSSAGAAASIAAALGPLAIGTDGGGSVRIPAAFCGVLGLKPSYGRAPFHDPAPWIVAGPITRSVGDAALAMNAITRPDTRDFTSLPYDARDYRHGLRDGVRGARIGLLEDIGFGLKIDPQVRDKLMQAARVFADLGAEVEPIAPLFRESPEPVFDRVLHIRTFLLFTTMTKAQQDAMLPVLADWCREANVGTKQDLMRALIDVGPIRRATLAPFDIYDFVLAPVMAVLPYEAQAPWPPGGTAHNPFCFPFSMSEQPAVSIPGGFSHEGLPIGLQIIGRRFDDRGVLRAAYAFEQATDFLGRWAEPSAP